MASRYYFHLLNSMACVRDEDGLELEDVDRAIGYAVEVLEELSETDPLLCETWRGWWLAIVDSLGRAVHIVPLDSFGLDRGILS